MHSVDMPEDAKIWLQATKGQRYMPPPPKKTTMKKIASKKRLVGGVDVKEFDDIPKSYIFGKPLVCLETLQDPNHASMRRLHTWYIHACKQDVSLIEAKVPYACFMRKDARIVFDFACLREMFNLDKLDMNMIRLWCL